MSPVLYQQTLEDMCQNCTSAPDNDDDQKEEEQVVVVVVWRHDIAAKSMLHLDKC